MTDTTGVNTVKVGVVMGSSSDWDVMRHAADILTEFGVPFEPAYRGWITNDRSQPGHIGDPRSATAEKGESLFRVFSDDLVKMLERVMAWNGSSWDG